MPTSDGVTADLAQSREGGEHLHAAFGDAFGLDGLHDRVAAAAEFGEVKFALVRAQLAVVPLLDAIGQILGDLGFDAPQQDGAQA